MRHILSVALALGLVLISVLSGCSGQSQGVTLSSPVNGSVVPTLSPVLTWGGGDSGAYRLMIATDSNFQNIITDISNIREPNYTIPSGRLAESTSYWWKVQAKSGNSASQWSQPWNFQTPGGVAPSRRGIIRINATLDGAAWSGSVNYAVSGPFKDTDNSLPWNYSDMEPGTYTISYNYGGPSGATLGNITPAPTQQLTEGGTIKFTLNFYRQSSSGITVNALLNGSPWTGNVNFSLSGPRSNSDVAVPRTYSGLPSGTYTLMYNSGGPSGAILSGVLPSATQSLSANGSLVYTLDFSTGQASNLTVSATLNGAPWSGPVGYSITGPASVSQGGVPYTMVNAPAGTYTINFSGGGPAGATLGGIVPSPSITLSGGRSGQFVLNFYTSQQVGNITVGATLNGTPWSGSMYYTINGPFHTSDVAVPRTYSSVPAGVYTITYTGGGPADAVLVSITPAPSQTLASGRTIAFNVNFAVTPSTGSISVRATLDGKPWQTAIGSGAINYSVHGPRSYSGSSMPAQYSGVPSGQYTLTYNSGGPIGASLSNIYPSPSQFLPAGGSIEFVLDFTGQTRGFVQVQVIYNGAPWSGQIGYVVNGPYVESGTSAPRTFQGAPAGRYGVTYRVGGPPGAKFIGVEPPSQILVEGGTAVFTIEFISQMPGPIPGPVPTPRPGPMPGPIPIPTPTPTPMPGPLKGVN